MTDFWVDSILNHVIISGNVKASLMKISVIIPVYNVEEYLAQCLESVIYQSYKDLEIIIVDDGSPDNSSAVYEKYAALDSRIKVIKQENGGLSAARNTGLDAATGDYVHFIDSDDYVSCDYYEKMLAAAIATDADIAAGGVVSQNGQKYSISYQDSVVLSRLAEKFKVTNALNVCVVWRYIYRREFLEKNGFRFEVGRIFEDILFTPDVIRLADRVVTVPGAYYYYVFNPNSILNKGYTPRHKEQYKYAEVKRDEFAKKYGLEYSCADPVSVYIYKFLPFKLLRKEVSADHIKYYLLGARVLKVYKK